MSFSYEYYKLKGKVETAEDALVRALDSCIPLGLPHTRTYNDLRNSSMRSLPYIIAVETDSHIIRLNRYDRSI